MAYADNADVSFFGSYGSFDGYQKEQLQALGKQFFWVVYHMLDPNYILFSWKKLHIFSKTVRLKDLHWFFERTFGTDPFDNQIPPTPA